MTKKRFIIVTLFILLCIIIYVFYVYKKPILAINQSKIKSIKIVYKPSHQFGKHDIEINLENEDYKKTIIKSLEKSVLAENNFYIKQNSLGEGKYRISILFDDTVKTYDVTHENIVWDNYNKRKYKNSEIVYVLRTIVSSELIRLNIKLE